MNSENFQQLPVDQESSDTTGEAMVASPAMGPAILLAMVSGNFIASRFATNSPITSDR